MQIFELCEEEAAAFADLEIVGDDIAGYVQQINARISASEQKQRGCVAVCFHCLNRYHDERLITTCLIKFPVMCVLLAAIASAARPSLHLSILIPTRAQNRSAQVLALCRLSKQSWAKPCRSHIMMPPLQRRGMPIITEAHTSMIAIS